MLKGLGGLGDMAKLMQQAQEMQSKMTEAQSRIAEIEAEGTSGAGMVKEVATAQGELKSLRVEEGLLDGSHEREVLEDLIVAAVNDAVRRAREEGQSEMAKVTDGFGLPPGMKLPFG